MALLEPLIPKSARADTPKPPLAITGQALRQRESASRSRMKAPCPLLSQALLPTVKIENYYCRIMDWRRIAPMIGPRRRFGYSGCDVCVEVATCQENGLVGAA